jgi:O-antigen ligase
MVRDFWATGVGAGAYQQAMVVYQQSPRIFYFNHAHNEYLQIVAEGGLLVAAPALFAAAAAASRIRARIIADRSAAFGIRAGAVGGLLAIAVQSIWETGLRVPANGLLFAVLAAIAMAESPGDDRTPTREAVSRSQADNV